MNRAPVFSPLFLVLILLVLSLGGCGDCMIPKNTMPPTSGDNWSFLPGYQPGQSVYENLPETAGEDTPQIPQEPPKLPENLGGDGEWMEGGGGVFWLSNPAQQKNPQTPHVPDANKQEPSRRDDAPSSSTSAPPDTGAMPISNPEPLKSKETKAKPQPDSGPRPGHYFDPAPNFSGSTNFLGGHNEPEPEEIDYSKYGNQLGFDPQRQTTFVINSSNGTITTFYPRHDVHFGDPRGGTQAVTTKDGKVVHEDFYGHDGKLARSVEVDPSTGIKTSTIFNPDGTINKTEKTNPDGTPFVPGKASTTDKDTGVTTTAEENTDGTRTITKTNKDDKVISKETKGKQDSNVLIEGAVTDPKTGVTRTGRRLKDGTTEITITDKSGKVIGTERRDASGKLMAGAPSSTGSMFDGLDAFHHGPMSQLSQGAATTPTAALDGGFARDMGAATGTIAMAGGSQSHPADDDYSG